MTTTLYLHVCTVLCCAMLRYVPGTNSLMTAGGIFSTLSIYGECYTFIFLQNLVPAIHYVRSQLRLSHEVQSWDRLVRLARLS